MRQCITKNAIKPKQLNDIRTLFLGNVSNYLKMSHPSALDPSFFQKTKAWKLGQAAKSRVSHRWNRQPQQMPPPSDLLERTWQISNAVSAALFH
jgi:hypothetical protein